MPTVHAITFNQVTYNIDDTTILQNISGHFPENNITTLLGPSGSGKTTVLKLCNGLISPTAGTITIQGENVNKYLPTELRRKVGIALQDAPMIRGTVFENLQLPAKLHGETVSRIKATSLLDSVGLETALLKKPASDLSGGQRQRLSLARTLVNEPSILLLDEITASLDQKAAQGIESLLQWLHEKHKVTIIWITHNQDQARRIADYTWLLKDGQLVESGKMNEIKALRQKESYHKMKGDNE